MDYLTNVDTLRNLRQRIVHTNHKAYREISSFCFSECANLNESELSEKEKECLVGCHKKLLKEVLPIYKKYFVNSELRINKNNEKNF